VGESASPYAEGFFRFDRVGETLEPDWAGSTNCFRSPDRIFPGVFVGVVLGEEYFRHVLAFGPAVCGENVQPLLDKGLSGVGHKLILREVSSE